MGEPGRLATRFDLAVDLGDRAPCSPGPYDVFGTLRRTRGDLPRGAKRQCGPWLAGRADVGRCLCATWQGELGRCALTPSAQIELRPGDCPVVSTARVVAASIPPSAARHLADSAAIVVRFTREAGV